MSLFKKVAAAAAASAMVLTLASCGKDTTWGAEIDGVNIRAGIMILFQSNALSEAYTYMGEGDTDVMALTIEDKTTEAWVNDSAKQYMREYAAVENKFNELGIKFENNEEEKVSILVDQWWEYYQDYFESIGVGKQSYLDVTLNSEKKNAIFDYYYGEGGEKAVSEDDIKAYLEENNARINYIKMELKDGEGNLLKSDGKAEIKTMAEGYIERIKNGEYMNTVGKEYADYYNALVKAAAEAASEENAAAEDAQTEVAYSDNTRVISKESTVPSAAVAEKVFDSSVKAGDVFLVEEDEVYYIVQKQELFADETYLENQRENVIHELKDEEFDQTVKSWTESQNAVFNDAAFERYKVKKLAEDN